MQRIGRLLFYPTRCPRLGVDTPPQPGYDRSTMPTDTLTYYATTILAQIGREVENLKQQLGYRPQYIELGYLVNTHHGYPLLEQGDLVAGVPVRIDRANPRTIRVCADNVRHVEEERVETEDGDIDVEERVWYEDHFRETTW